MKYYVSISEENEKDLRAFCDGFFSSKVFHKARVKNSTVHIFQLSETENIPQDKLYYIIVAPSQSIYKQIKKLLPNLSSQYRYSMSYMRNAHKCFWLISREDTASYSYDNEDDQKWLATKDFSTMQFTNSATVSTDYTIGSTVAYHIGSMMLMDELNSINRLEVMLGEGK